MSRPTTVERSGQARTAGGFLVLALALIGLVAVFAGQLIESRLQQAVDGDLASAGLGGIVGVEVRGQNAHVNSANPERIDEAVERIGRIDGIRTVSFDAEVALPIVDPALNIDTRDLPDRSDIAAALGEDHEVLSDESPAAAATDTTESLGNDSERTSPSEGATQSGAGASRDPTTPSSSPEDLTRDTGDGPDQGAVTETDQDEASDAEPEDGPTTSRGPAERTVAATIGDGTVSLAGRLRSIRDQGTLLDTVKGGSPSPSVKNGIRIMRIVEEGDNRSLLAFAILTNRLATSYSVASAELIGDEIRLGGRVRSADTMGDIDEIIQTARDTGVPITSTLTVADGGPVIVDDRPVLQQDLDRIVDRTPIQFVGSRTELTPVARSAVQAVAAAIRRSPGWDIEVRGHTDSEGIETENYTLSRQRAETVYTLLIEAGIDPDTLSFRGYGSTAPSPLDERGERIDERIEFVIKQHVESVVTGEEDDGDDRDTE